MNKQIIVKQAPPAEGVFRLGLEKDGKQLFGSTMSSFSIPTKNNGTLFLHGLNKEDQKIVEKYYGRKFDDPEAREAWASMIFNIKHTLNPYDKGDPEGMLTLGIMKAMGLAASNTDELKENSNFNYNFIITNEDEEIEEKASLYARQDEAIVELSKLKSGTKKYLIAIAKFLLPKTINISQDENRGYLKLREYIEGKFSTSKIEAVNNFMNALAKDKGELYVTVDFKEAVKKNIIRKNAKKYFSNPLTGAEYGKTEAEALKFLLNPANQEELGTGSSTDENYSIRYQLKQKR